MAASRKQIRERMAALLTSGVPSAQAIFDHQPGTFEGQSPVITVSSGGSDRSRMTFRGGQSTFTIDLYLFVRVAEAGNAAYTQAQAEDLLDDCEHAIATVVESNQVDDTGPDATHWQAVAYAGRSNTVFVVVDGKEYKREHIPLIITVFG